MTGREDGFSVLGHIASGHLGFFHRRVVLRTETQYFYQYIPSILMAYFTLFTIFYSLGNAYILFITLSGLIYSYYYYVCFYSIYQTCLYGYYIQVS